MSALDQLEGKELYEILGVEDSATEKEIKKAYRKASLTCHPDKNPSEEAAVKFRTLSLVLEVLSNENLRREYDLTRKARLENSRRTAARDSQRRKMQEDLEQRERAAFEDAMAQTDLERKLEMLKREGLEKRERYQQQQASESTSVDTKAKVSEASVDTSHNASHYTAKIVKITVKVAEKAGLSKGEVASLLRKSLAEYGAVDSLVITEKIPRFKYIALVQFTSTDMSTRAAEGLNGSRLGPPSIKIESAKRLGAKTSQQTEKTEKTEKTTREIPVKQPEHAASYKKSTLDRLRSSKTTT